jgi:glycosyltransferase involved in cell wall biosynthesis
MENGQLAYPIHEAVDIKYIPDRSPVALIRRLIRIKNITVLLKQIKPDIVICFGMLVGVIAPKLLGIKTIYSERGDPGSKTNEGLVGIIRSITFPWLDGFVFQVKGAKMYFSQNIQKKSVVIPNPVYMKYDDYTIPNKREKIIVNVGRLHHQKNQRLLISAFNEIAEEFPDYNLHIYGQDGGLESELKEYVHWLQLDKRICFMGTTSNLWDEILNASLFVLSSDYEGMPNALMEAMALGIPCVSTDCPPGGPAALIKHNENGLLCPINDVKSLMNCMRLMLKDRERAEKMALLAKEICYTHTVEKVMNQWRNYINQVVGN